KSTNRNISVMLGTIIIAGGLCLPALGEATPEGLVDFGKFAPPSSGGEFVEVNVSTSLISLAARLIEKDEPEVAQLLKGLKSVRVNVIGLDDGNRSDLEKRIQSIRKQLDNRGWERVVTAQQKNEDVSVYLKMRDDSVQGIVVMAIDGKHEAVFVNVLGDIQPEKLALLGEKLHIEPLKKLAPATEKHGKEKKSE